MAKRLLMLAAVDDALFFAKGDIVCFGPAAPDHVVFHVDLFAGRLVVRDPYFGEVFARRAWARVTSPYYAAKAWLLRRATDEYLAELEAEEAGWMGDEQ